MPKPNDLAALRESLETYYGLMHSEMLRDEDFYYRRYRKLFSAGSDVATYDIPIYEGSTAANIVNSYRFQINTESPTVVFRPPGSSRKSLDSASEMQLWGYAMLRKERENSSVDPYAQNAFDGLLRGAACKKITVDVENIPVRPASKKGQAWRDYQAALSSYWPFVSRAIDPISVFPAPSRTTPLPYVLEVQKRTVLDVMVDYPAFSDPEGRKARASGDFVTANNPARAVTWLEYWSVPVYRDGEVVEEGHYIVEIDGDRVIDKENPCGFVPYVFEYSGYGRIDQQADPSTLGVGILRDIRGDLGE